MKTNAVGALLVTLLVAPSPAMAGYSCVVKETVGDPSTRHQRLTATAADINNNTQTRANLEQVIELGAPDSEKKMRRFFVIDYWGMLEDPWYATNLGFNFPAYVKLPARPLFAFLILDSGEHVERLVMDANGRDNYGFKAQVGPYTPIPRITISFGLVYTSPDAGDRAFLNALGKAKQMSIELKFADGETLTRETFDVSRSDVMQRAMDTAIGMYKGNTEKCEFIPSQVEL
jgi:hypothetical protein